MRVKVLKKSYLIKTEKKINKIYNKIKKNVFFQVFLKN